MSTGTITVHHLEHSRSQRIIWLLEELNVPYEVKVYRRDQHYRAPPELKEIHVLGKSPVITDGGITVAETGAIIAYLLHKYDKDGKFEPSEDNWVINQYWTHFCEGTFMPNSTFSMVAQMATDSPLLNPPLEKTTAAQLTTLVSEPVLRESLTMIEEHLSKLPEGGNFAGGTNLTSADIMMIFPLETSLIRRPDAVGPKSKAWVERIQARPTYQKALENGGPYKYKFV